MDLCRPNNNFYYLLASAGYLTASVMAAAAPALLAFAMKEAAAALKDRRSRYHCCGLHILNLKDGSHDDNCTYRRTGMYLSGTRSNSLCARSRICYLDCNSLLSSIHDTVWRLLFQMGPVQFSSAV